MVRHILAQPLWQDDGQACRITISYGAPMSNEATEPARKSEEATATEARLARDIYVTMVFGRDLFDVILANGGKEEWNAFTESMREHLLWNSGSVPVPETGACMEFCRPIVASMDLSGQAFRNADLSGLDLSWVNLNRCDFSGANLAGSTIFDCEGALFRDADLRGAHLVSDVSNADFTGAWFEGSSLDLRYDRHSPPRGLPDDILSRIKPSPSMNNYSRPSDRWREIAIPTLSVQAKARSYWKYRALKW